MEMAAALFVQPSMNTITSNASSNGGANGKTNARPPPHYDHPKLTAIMANLQYEFNEYKYTVYRCASKFVTLQKCFHTSKIPYKLVLAVLASHGMGNNEMNLMVPPFQLTTLICDIYKAAEKLGHFSGELEYRLEEATEVLGNFFWNCYDPYRRHSISLLEIKVTYLLLSKLSCSDQLFDEFYRLLADKRTKCVTKFSFEYLLNILIKMLTYVGEGNAYGAHNAEIVMEQCFIRGHHESGLSEYQFQSLWSRTHTRFLIYANLIALIKRIEDTQKLVHQNQCASCRTGHIVGIRFKCQTCRALNLCLKCFATGYASNRHESGHRMYEVFTEDAPPRRFSHYFAKLCGMLCISEGSTGGQHEDTKGFFDKGNETNAPHSINDTEMVTIAGSQQSSRASTIRADGVVANNATGGIETPPVMARAEVQEYSKLEPSIVGLSATANSALNVSQRLQSIIDRLGQQNQKLEQQLKLVKEASNEEISEFLTAHQKFLVDIINEMRNFSHPSQSVSSYPTSSTPNRSAALGDQVNILGNFSAAGSNLTHSINGADINRSYLDANKSDYSLQDLSSWFYQRRRQSMPSMNQGPRPDMITEENAMNDQFEVEMRETAMANFKLLLHKVKEIVEDSYSDNTQLSEATQNLENALDSIIAGEEKRRSSS